MEGKKYTTNNEQCSYKENRVKVTTGNRTQIASTLFISYTECDTPIVDIIEKKICEKLKNRIIISRYNRLKYKDSFKAFMNTIQEHDFVLTVVSDTYLKRQACMYEVGEIIKDHHYKDKLLFVVLSENERKYYGDKAPVKITPNIYGGALEKLDYIKYWQEKYNKLKEKMNLLDDYVPIREAIKELQIVEQIYKKDMVEFLEFLSDENGKSFEKLYANEFEELISWIFPQYNFNIFKECNSFEKLLFEAIEHLQCVSQTDYNQIALGVKTDSYTTGLVVFADNIPIHKQSYRLVVMNGLMAKVFITGNQIVVDNVNKEPDYFCAVLQTRSELILPIKFNGRVIGVFNSESEQLNYYDAEMIETLLKILEDFAYRIIELGYIGSMLPDDISYVHI